MKIQLPGETGMEIGSDDYNALAQFVNFLIPGIIDNSGIAQDNAKYKRWENMQNLLRKAKTITDKSGDIPTQPLLKIVEPLLEYASLEADSELQDKWANLLANAIAGMDIKASYLSILRELSSVEVKILDLIYQDLISTQKLLSDVQFDSKIIAQRFNISIHDMYAKVDNLKRLQLIESPAVQGISMGGYPPTGHTRDSFQITYLGVDFIKACKLT